MPSYESEMDDPFNPLRQPERIMVALAKGAMPVLIDRLGGTVVITKAEMHAIEHRYGGSVGVTMTRVPDGSIELRLVPSKRRVRKPSDRQ